MTAARSLAVLLALAVLGAAAWLVGTRFLAEDGQGDLAVGPAQGAEPAVAAPAPPVELQGPASPRAGAAPAAAARSEVESAPPEPAPGSQRVAVVDAGTQAPLPLATLRFAGVDGRVYDHPAWDLEEGDAWMEEHGTQVALDAEGIARIDASGFEKVLVIADAPGLWGRTWFEVAADSDEVLELQPDVTLRARVVDAAGTPVATVPVALRRRHTSWKNDIVVRPSDAEGRVAFRHASQHLSEDQDWRYSLAIATVLAEPVEEAFDSDAPPLDEVLLSVPATGSLEVVVHPLAGGPPLEGGRVELSLHEEGREDMPSFWHQPDGYDAEIVDGSATFEHVGLGLTVAAEARTEHSNRPTREVGPGPTFPGDRARLELALGSDHPVLRVRLLEPTGEAAALQDFQVRLQIESVSGSDDDDHDASSDADGVLWYDYPRFVEPDAKTHLTVLRAAQAEHPGASAELDIARELVDGLNDLGEATLGAARVLASGRLARADGTPVEGARIRVHAVRVQDGGATWLDSQDQFEPRTDAEGRFEILGTLDTESLRLSAREGELVAEPQTVRVGTIGIELVAWEAGRVRGRVLVDEAVDASVLRVRLEPAEQAARGDWRARGRANVAADGGFLVSGLQPGTYDLKVTPESTSELLGEVAGIVVASGETTTDARLEPIDLRGRLTCFTLELVPPKPSDRVIGVVQLSYSDHAGEAQKKTQFINGLSNDMCFSAAAVDLSVHAQGFRTVSFTGLRQDVRVELERGLRVRLRLVGEVELPVPPRHLKAFLSDDSNAPTWSLGHFQDEVFDESREIVVYAGGPGPHRVSWLLETRKENSLSTGGLGVEEPQIVEVLDVPGEQVFEVVAPTAELAKRLSQD